MIQRTYDKHFQYLYRTGQYNKTIQFHTEALAIRERTLDSEDPDLATSLNNLAGLYDSRGKYLEVEPLYQRAFKVFKGNFSLEHPKTKTVLTNYVDFLVTNDMPEKALLLSEDLEHAGLKNSFPRVFAQDPTVNEK